MKKLLLLDYAIMFSVHAQQPLIFTPATCQWKIQRGGGGDEGGDGPSPLNQKNWFL